MPNRALLSFAYFTSGDRSEASKLAQQLRKEGQEGQADTHTPPSQGSRKSSAKGHTRGDSAIKRTESEILNDPEIWDISSSGDEASSQSEKEPAEAIEDKNESEEQELARYLVDSCPGVPEKKIEQLQDLESREARLYVARKKEAACQSLAELCILKCVRPEVMDQAMERLVSQVIDSQYSDFRKDLLD